MSQIVAFLGLAGAPAAFVTAFLTAFFTAFLGGAFFALDVFFAVFFFAVPTLPTFFLLAFFTSADRLTIDFAAAAMLSGASALTLLLPAVDRISFNRAWFFASRLTSSGSSSSYNARCSVPSSLSARSNIDFSAGSTSPARNVRIGSSNFAGSLICLSMSALVGALPAAVFSCLRRFCVDRMPLLKKADTSPKLSVTWNSLVSPASPQTNIGIGVPLNLPGCAVGEGGTATRPGACGPTGTISYLARKGARTCNVLRLRRKVRSRQENFWIRQTLVSCSSNFGLDWVLKATHAGNSRRSSVSRLMRVIMKPRQSLILPSVFHAR